MARNSNITHRVSHESHGPKHYETSVDGGSRVTTSDDQGVAMTVLVEGVVGGQYQLTGVGNSQAVEHLRK